MDSQIRISDLENVISEKIFIKIEKWNLYLGDAGLARNLAIECISNKKSRPIGGYENKFESNKCKSRGWC